MQTSLQTDSLGVLLEYRSRGKPDEGVFRLITARRADSRLTVRGIRAEDPMTLIVGSETLIFDEGLIGSLYFVGLAPIPRVISLVSLQRQFVVKDSVTSLGGERIVIGRDTVDAQHLILGAEGQMRREIWIDSQKRLLKVWVPLTQSLAIRDKRPG